MNIQDLYLAACRTPSDISDLLPVLHEYAKLCPRVTEFGVRGGNSTAALLAAHPAVYRGYDLEAHDNHAKLLEAVRGRTDAVIHYKDTTQLDDIEGTDLLFVDSLHTADQVRAELKHQRRVSRYLLFHDTVTFGTHGEVSGTEGIRDAIRECLGDDWRLVEEHLHCNGLQVWERK